MADIGSILGKLGIPLKGKGAKPGAAPAGKAAPGAKPAAGTPGAKKGFDINLYFKAVGLFFNDFFNKKLPYFFKNMGPVFKNAGPWWNKLPGDEKASYGVLAFGHVLVIVGIVLFIVL